MPNGCRLVGQGWYANGIISQRGVFHVPRPAPLGVQIAGQPPGRCRPLSAALSQPHPIRRPRGQPVSPCPHHRHHPCPHVRLEFDSGQPLDASSSGSHHHRHPPAGRTVHRPALLPRPASHDGRLPGGGARSGHLLLLPSSQQAGSPVRGQSPAAHGRRIRRGGGRPKSPSRHQ